MEQANFATQTLKDTKTTVCKRIFSHSSIFFFVRLYYSYVERIVSAFNKSLTTQQNKGNFEMYKCKY